jgi:hypothetical protein
MGVCTWPMADKSEIRRNGSERRKWTLTRYLITCHTTARMSTDKTEPHTSLPFIPTHPARRVNDCLVCLIYQGSFTQDVILFPAGYEKTRTSLLLRRLWRRVRLTWPSSSAGPILCQQQSFEIDSKTQCRRDWHFQIIERSGTVF